MRKNIFFEAVGIIIVSTLFAIVYNYLMPRPISIIPKSKSERIAPDSVLFGDNSNNNMPEKTIIDSTNTDKMADTVEVKTIDTTSITKDTINTNISNKLADSVKTEKPKKTNSLKNLDYEITYDNMVKIVDRSDFVIIDARSPDLYSQGHIGNAINIFPYEDEATYVQKIFDLPQNKRIVVYCDGGTCDLSHHVAEDLVNNFNFENVFIYKGGWEDWIKHNNNAM